MATPFVQGRLRQEHLTVTIDTACAHSRRPMRIVLDSDMKVSAVDERSTPLVFMPQIDWAHFSEPNIIDVY